MAAKNVSMVDKAQAIPTEEIKSPTFGELTTAFQLGINIILQHHIHAVLNIFIKDSTTVTQITSLLRNTLEVNIKTQMNLVAPYIDID
jgi:hypothetical protein